jgi:hypothetical protein
VWKEQKGGKFMKIGQRVQLQNPFNATQIIKGFILKPDTFDADLGYWIIRLDYAIRQHSGGFISDIVVLEDNLEIL